jgi:ABC-type bacteriocin/lantibiotic exporter with double-glycine peptidase domain
MIKYNRVFFLSEMTMQKDYIYKILGLPVNYYEKEYGVSKSAALLDDGIDEVMMRFQDFVSIVFKSLAVVCVTGWIFYISNVYVVLFLVAVIVLEFFVSEKISRKISECEEKNFQCSVKYQNSQRVFVNNTEQYAMAGVGEYWESHLKNNIENMYDSRKKVIKLQNLTDILMGVMDLITYLFIILYGIFVEESMISPLVITMSYEMIKDIVIDFFESILRIQQKVYAIKEFETIKEKTQVCDKPKEGDIILDNVSLYANEKVLLENININIHKGSKVLIVGENGAGKTLLLKIISGIYEGENSDIKVNGKVIISDAAFAPVERIFFPISIYENINLCCENNLDYNEVIERFNSFSSCPFSFDEEYDNYENHFSLGQMDMMGFFRMVYSDKKLIVLDEPFAHADIELKQKMWDKLMNLDKTVIVVEHDYTDVAKKYNPYTIMMKDGKITEFCQYRDIPINNVF